MNREQMISHFILGGWTPLKFGRDKPKYTVIFRGPESCVYDHMKNRRVKHDTSTWHSDTHREYVCSWDALTNDELVLLSETEAMGEGVAYEP